MSAVQPGYGRVSEEVRTSDEIAEHVTSVVQIWKSVTILPNKRFQPEIVKTKKA